MTNIEKIRNMVIEILKKREEDSYEDYKNNKSDMFFKFNIIEEDYYGDDDLSAKFMIRNNYGIYSFYEIKLYESNDKQITLFQLPYKFQQLIKGEQKES